MSRTEWEYQYGTSIMPDTKGSYLPTRINAIKADFRRCNVVVYASVFWPTRETKKELK